LSSISEGLTTEDKLLGFVWIDDFGEEGRAYF
jgi:hypothetical protein